MLKNLRYSLIILALLAASACTRRVTIIKPVPPGQAKKTMAPGQVKKRTGSQSAAPYAPGQQKKAAATAQPANSKKGNSSSGNGNQKKK